MREKIHYSSQHVKFMNVQESFKALNKYAKSSGRI